ncbi:MAG: hypothetical protein JWM04_1122 [Verrucomicrobiales bacterium]|nr:hypothetical protein [Verrucomicrobiales bacterium]
MLGILGLSFRWIYPLGDFRRDRDFVRCLFVLILHRSFDFLIRWSLPASYEFLRREMRENRPGPLLLLGHGPIKGHSLGASRSRPVLTHFWFHRYFLVASELASFGDG